MQWPHIRKKRDTHTRDIDIWRVKAIFNNFRRILQINTIVFEAMAEMDRTLGGEYIFDKSYLEEAVRTIASHAHHVTYNLNALTKNRHIDIYDKYQEIRTILDDILVGNYQDLYCPPVLPLHTLSWELEPLVGVNLVCLAELKHHPGIQPADGIVLTCGATKALCEQESAPDHPGLSRKEVEEELLKYIDKLLPAESGAKMTVSASQINEDMGETHDLGEFEIIAGQKGRPASLQERFSEISSLHMPLDGSHSHDFSLLPPTKALEGPSRIDQYKRGIEKIVEVASTRLQQTDDCPTPSFALFIRFSPTVTVSGTVTTRTKSLGAIPLLSITAHLPGQPETSDSYQLKRVFPFDLVSSKLVEKGLDQVYPGEQLATDRDDRGKCMRGSSFLPLEALRSLAETAMTLERVMGAPITMQWEYRQSGELVINRLFPFLEKPEEPTAAELSEEMDSAIILAEGGRLVQSGVAAGIVVHVTEQTNPEDFPAGAIAVAPVATPQLTPILHRASAILTEHGNPVGHLATVARELNLPALFGVPNIVKDLTPGEEVTIDTGMQCVFKGVVKSLVQLGYSELAFSPVDPEYRILRRLLRFITPLNLVDPDSPKFSASECRSFHDIIHFCHETAVDELAHFQERRPELSGIKTSLLQLPLPLNIHLLDIGDGLHSLQGKEEPALSDIRSEPFAIFTDGLLNPMAATDEIPVLGIRDIITAIPKTSSQMNAREEQLAGNLAIISTTYMNLSLRLGYHFSVIDAHLSSDRHRNYIYFRFIGGLANSVRRARRARFIERVLTTMDFKVERKGDLVVGRMKFEQKSVFRSALFVLGALTTYTRQRDTALDNDEKVDVLFRSFANTFLLPFGKKTAKSPQR